MDFMIRRNIDLLCVQETRWKGSASRDLGSGFKLLYSGGDTTRNGVGIVLHPALVLLVKEITRVSDRLMAVTMQLKEGSVCVISGYAPQQGCDDEEKLVFLNSLEDLLGKTMGNDMVLVAGDLNAHLGKDRRGYEEVLGPHSIGSKNAEGEALLELCLRNKMCVVNTWFEKQESHKVTYRSGSAKSQIDFILVRKQDMKKITDCKVIPSEVVAPQHKPVVATFKMKKWQQRELASNETRLKTWKLRGTVVEDFSKRVLAKAPTEYDNIQSIEQEWGLFRNACIGTAEELCGRTSYGKRHRRDGDWWWNEEVQLAVRNKQEARKNMELQNTSETKKAYKVAKQAAKCRVAEAKFHAATELYDRLDSKEGLKMVYAVAKQRQKGKEDTASTPFVNSSEGVLVTNPEGIKKRWKEYFEALLNEENPFDGDLPLVPKSSENAEMISEEEVERALKKMKSGKSVGPDELSTDMLKALGRPGIKWITRIMRVVWQQQRIPDDWRTSVLVPIFKKKGNIHECAQYRGIKLLSHSLKLLEKVVEARLRKIVEEKLGEEQCGFRPG